MPNVHVRSISNPQARTKYLESLGTYEDSRAGPRHVQSISIPQARTKYLESLGTYEASQAGPRHVRRFSYESPVSVHLRLLGRAGTVLYCAVVLTPEVVSCAGARAVAGAGAGAGPSAGRRFAFCLSIARVHFIWLVYCARTG